MLNLKYIFKIIIGLKIQENVERGDKQLLQFLRSLLAFLHMDLGRDYEQFCFLKVFFKLICTCTSRFSEG